VLNRLLRTHGHCIVKYKEHDSLFDEDEPERLTNEDRQLAEDELLKGINTSEPLQQQQRNQRGNRQVPPPFPGVGGGGEGSVQGPSTVAEEDPNTGCAVS
jgi:hypothetical protein